MNFNNFAEAANSAWMSSGRGENKEHEAIAKSGDSNSGVVPDIYFFSLKKEKKNGINLIFSFNNRFKLLNI